MALRKIRSIGDSCLGKKCREVDKFDSRLHTLIDDMRETLLYADGMGLAAPQVGILKRVVVINAGEDNILEFVNPVMTEAVGSVIDAEACLSVPGKIGEVERPQKVKITAFDRYGNEFSCEGEDLMARCMCHELDHLDGILYTAKVIRYIEREEDEQ
ncbi:MAG: peptide deformylase [Clostridia bacterium]|nr:peptide deformylase [Clostridia bacterium]